MIHLCEVHQVVVHHVCVANISKNMSSFEIVCGFRCETVEKFNIAVKEIILVSALLSTVDDLVCAAKHIALCGAFAYGYSNECLSVLVGHVARHLPCAVAACLAVFLCHVDYLPFHFVADRSEGIQGIVENLNMMNIVEVKIDKQRIMVSPLASIEEDNERRK